jgi:hypothetical protein
MRHLRTSFTLLAVLLTAGIGAAAAIAASKSVAAKSSASPNAPRAASNVKASAGAFATESTLPSTMSLNLKGFSIGSVGSATTMCSSADESSNSCPASSVIGSGAIKALVKPAPFGALNPTIPLTLTFYLGPPRSAGCAATVMMSMALKRGAGDSLLQWPPQVSIGDLCSHAGGVKLNYPDFPSSSMVTAGSKVTVEQLSLDLGSEHGQSLWHNPSSCHRTWSGSITLGFAHSSAQAPLAIACR